MDPVSRDRSEQDMSLPRRRLTLDLNGPSRISLLANSQKKLSEKKANPTKGIGYDPLDFVDSSFDLPSSSRRRTVQLNEILSQQQESQESNKRLLYESSSSPKKVARLDEDYQRIDEEEYIHEKATLLNTLRLYEAQLKEMAQLYEQLKKERTTEQEAAIENHSEWAQVKDEGYIALRDQIEEYLAKNKKPMNRINNKQSEQINDLKATVLQLQQQLQQKNKEVNDKTKTNLTEKESRAMFDMYEDLTGVIVTGVKKGDNDNLYKCVIAGKNGTLQFSLFISKERNQPVCYSPILDRQRDAKLISILPDFLKEDVEFERENLPTLFWRLSSIIH